MSINTISSGHSHENGSQFMSYHVQHNSQQKSLGIFIVIAFHLLLIWGLASGLGVTLINKIPPAITINPNQEKITPPEEITLIEPVIKTNVTLTSIPTEKVTFEPERVISTETILIGTEETIIASKVSKPKLLKATKPDYPSTAVRLGEEGATGLNLLINTDGRVADAQVYSSSNSTRLDEAAIKHAKRNWTFTPCTENGKTVACWYQTKLVWRLEDAAR